MKIGILTLPQETNYGGILQAYALQHTLRKMGHDAITIDRHNRKEYPSWWIHLAGYCKRIVQRYLLGKNVTTKWNPFVSPEEYAVLSSEIQGFIDRNIQLTKRVFSDELAEIEKEYQFDAYVVGSDQVWQDFYCPASFLDFVQRSNVKRVTYAASCNRSSFLNNPAKIKVCGDLAKLFSGISVREDYLVPLCKDKLGIDVQWVLDPTMLLSPNEYLEASENRVGEEPVFFTYILDVDDDKTGAIHYLSSKLGLPIVSGNRINESQNGRSTYPSVDNWIHNLNRSRYVVTDSFHGTVFSILFNKPFISIGNSKRGMARFQSLLGRFGLEDRLVQDYLDADNLLEKIVRPIDFSLVNSIIQKERSKSLDFLIKALDNNG